MEGNPIIVLIKTFVREGVNIKATFLGLLVLVLVYLRLHSKTRVSLNVSHGPLASQRGSACLSKLVLVHFLVLATFGLWPRGDGAKDPGFFFFLTSANGQNGIITTFWIFEVSWILHTLFHCLRENIHCFYCCSIVGF